MIKCRLVPKFADNIAQEGWGLHSLHPPLDTALKLIITAVENVNFSFLSVTSPCPNKHKSRLLSRFLNEYPVCTSLFSKIYSFVSLNIFVKNPIAINTLGSSTNDDENECNTK